MLAVRTNVLVVVIDWSFGTCTEVTGSRAKFLLEFESRPRERHVEELAPLEFASPSNTSSGSLNNVWC